MTGIQGASRTPFPETRWSLVRSAAQGADAALQELCAAYHKPVYAFFRRSKHPPALAADLTQEFFATRILDPGKRATILRDGEPLLVRFRTFLSQCLRNFAINVHHYESAQKRGGGRKKLSLDFDQAERSLGLVEDDDPAAAFDLLWAKSLVDRVFERLSKEIKEDARAILRGTVQTKPDREIAAALGISVNAVAKNRQRTLARARRILVAELSDTLSSPEDVKSELRELGRIYALPSWLLET